MRETPIGDEGVGEDSETGALDFTTQHLNFDGRTRGRTLFVVFGGDEPFDTVTVEGQLPTGTWVTAKGEGLDDDGNLLDLAVDVSGPGVYILGADYTGLRVKTTGGSDHVDEVVADPDHMPDPIVGVPEVLASTITAGIV